VSRWFVLNAALLVNTQAQYKDLGVVVDCALLGVVAVF